MLALTNRLSQRANSYAVRIAPARGAARDATAIKQEMRRAAIAALPERDLLRWSDSMRGRIWKPWAQRQD